MAKYNRKHYFCMICNKKHHARGFCYTHYSQYKVGIIDILGNKLRNKKKCGMKKGWKHLKRTKIQMSIIAKEKGFGRWMKGKKLSKEWIENRRKSQSGKNHYNWKGGKPKCIDCGKQLTNYKTIRCIKCVIGTKGGKNNPAYIDGRTMEKYYCVDCGKETSNWTAKRCQSCMMKARTGEKANNWQGGISKEPYPFKFNDSLKEQIRKRDNYECQGRNCDITEEEHLIVYGQNLTIHHIDYNKMNIDPSNLITLCLQCNTRANFNRQYWQKYFLILTTKVEINAEFIF